MSRMRWYVLWPVMIGMLWALAPSAPGWAQGTMTQNARTESTTTPVARSDDWWVKRHASMNDRVKQGNVDLVLIGDSITHGWEETGSAVWSEYYADRNAVNLGISGDRTQHVLWRLDNGNVDGISPKLAVVMIGTNNYEDNSAEEIADGVKRIVEKLRAKLPETKVLLLAIFPRTPKPGPVRDRLAKASELASAVADGKMVHYLDIGRAFLEPDGTLPESVMPDFLHPNAKGYAIWAEAMEPKVAELLGEVASGKAPKGFVPLFDGKTLTGWKGLVADPEKRAKMRPQDLAEKQAEADASMRAHWKVEDGVLHFDGKGEALCTARDYEDFEMLVDWKIGPKGDSGIYLRGSPQVQIWDPAQWPQGSGGLYNNKKHPNDPLVCADRPIGEWNTFRIKMVGENVTVWLNDKLVVDNVVMENYWNYDIPIYDHGQIELQNHGSDLWFRNLFIREIPRGEGWRPLFNGKDLTGWEQVGGEKLTWGVENGILFTDGGGGGWLSTLEEFADFELELEFRVPVNGNSGVFVRAPREGNPAFEGSEIQVLDDYGDEYKSLEPGQYCGSLYKWAPPSRRVTLPAGEWQKMRIRCEGPRMSVVLNCIPIVDEDASQHPEHYETNPGLKRTQGYIGLQNHGSRLDYRNIRIRPL